jgi:hypothetical protein
VDRLLAPASRQGVARPWPPVLVLVGSAVALLLAPLLMPDGYTWWSHTTSESAAQALPGAWLARAGFLAFGLGVVWIAVSARDVSARTVVWLHVVFGVCLVATAAFSHRPWLERVPFDRVEDALHSLSATVMGFAFAFGVLARWLQERWESRVGPWIHLAAVTVATVVPLAMLALPAAGGLLQRAMFAVAYAWYAREALQLGWRRPADSPDPTRPVG